MLQRTLPAGFIALPSGGQWLLKMKNPGCSAVKREAEELGALTSPAGIQAGEALGIALLSQKMVDAIRRHVPGATEDEISAALRWWEIEGHMLVGEAGEDRLGLGRR
jgi:hypothetical protein